VVDFTVKIAYASRASRIFHVSSSVGEFKRERNHLVVMDSNRFGGDLDVSILQRERDTTDCSKVIATMAAGITDYTNRIVPKVK